MRKKRNRPKVKAPPPQSAPAKQPSRKSSLTRRRLLRGVVGSTLAIGALGGVGYYLTSSVMASIAEADLTRIGNGLPSIVQIHDPNCNLCLALQRQTRRALSDFDDSRFEYLVANIKKRDGAALATKHSVPHVTLLLFDGAGNLKRKVRGPINYGLLQNYISSHLSSRG